MEISDRKDLDKLIAYSKSFRPTDLEPDFDEQYTPPGTKSLLFEPPIIEEEFNLPLDDASEEQLFQNLKNSILNPQQQAISSENDNNDELTQEEAQNAPEPVAEPPPPQCQPDMTEYNKVSEEVLQFLDQSKGRRSLFTETLKTRKCNTISISNGKPIKIYFFNTPQMVQIFVNKNTTVTQVLRMAIESYLENPKFDKNQLRFKDYPEGYEIRIVDDDFEYRADMAFAAIDRKKEILSTQTTVFAFVEVPGFKPPQTQQINQMIERISKDANLIILDVIFSEKGQNMSSQIQLPKDSLVGGIIEKLSQRNTKVNQRDYQVQCRAEEELIDLDFRMPAIQLQGKQLIVSKRQWADQAQDQEKETTNAHEMHEDQQSEAPLNHIQAFKYEKFEVVKINERGKRQDRILGIDQFRIYNMNKKSHLNIFEKLLNNKETGTKYPERLIEDIVDIKIAGQHLFINFKQDGNEKEKFKELKFDAKDAKMALKIYNKINFVRDFQSQNKTRKTRTFSQKIE